MTNETPALAPVLYPSLSYRVLDTGGNVVAGCASGEEAGCLVSFLGEGATVKHGRRTVWTEGTDGTASESFDAAAATMIERILR